MSTQFFGEGNIGSAPEFKELPNGNDAPRRLLRLNVYFDNPIPRHDGVFEDRGGFWAPVTWWHEQADRWVHLFQKRMRVLVIGRMERAEWTDSNNQPRETWQINARSIAILPHRLASVLVSVASTTGQPDMSSNAPPENLSELPFGPQAADSASENNRQ